MAAPHASYACDPDKSRGRLFQEPPSRTRSPFRRDCDRVIHSTAFRRLKHKTQVFVFHEGDHYRTRLTHSLEVAQIARALARQLGLDEDLTETLALAHDLGHPPFGHAGERALDACLKSHGGFDHNAQTLRVVTALEHRYPDFDGLNLTWESLEGIVKHNGPLTDRNGAAFGGHGVPIGIADYVRTHDLELWSFASLEAQVAAIADNIAYNNHDVDDGLRAGLFAVADLADVPLVGPVFHGVASRYPGIEESRLIHESIRRLIDRMVGDLIGETSRRLGHIAPGSVDEVRALNAPIVDFSDEMRRNDRALKQFLFERMYRHHRVKRMSSKAHGVVHDLFALYLAEPQRLPREWREFAAGPAQPSTARVAADYLAGMTDRFALDEHHRLFDTCART